MAAEESRGGDKKGFAYQTRLDRGLSRKDVARRAEISEDYLGQIERGRGTCSYPLALRLGRIVGIDAKHYAFCRNAGVKAGKTAKKA